MAPISHEGTLVRISQVKKLSELQLHFNDSHLVWLEMSLGIIPLRFAGWERVGCKGLGEIAETWSRSVGSQSSFQWSTPTCVWPKARLQRRNFPLLLFVLHHLLDLLVHVLLWFLGVSSAKDTYQVYLFLGTIYFLCNNFGQLNDDFRGFLNVTNDHKYHN